MNPPPPDFTNSPNTNLYAGLPAFHPNYLQGDVLTQFWRRRGGGGTPLVGPSPGTTYDPMRGKSYAIPGSSTYGGDPLTGLNARAMAVLGLTPPQSPGMGQGFGFGGQPGDLVKRLLQARFGGL